MTSLMLVKAPDPRLHIYAVDVPDDEIEDAFKMCELMFDAMQDWNGVGLASTQVALTGRYFVMLHDPKTLMALVNPKIIDAWGSVVGDELCLSVPGVTIEKARAKSIEVEWMSPSLHKIKMKCEGLTAIIVQHEIDHLNGKLITDK